MLLYAPLHHVLNCKLVVFFFFFESPLCGVLNIYKVCMSLLYLFIILFCVCHFVFKSLLVTNH